MQSTLHNQSFDAPGILLAPVAETVPVEEHLCVPGREHLAPRPVVRFGKRGRHGRLNRSGMQTRPLRTHPSGREEDAMTSQAAARAGLKQETIAIAAVGLTLLGAILLTTSRLEARIERVEVRMERVQAETRAEARADREAVARDREAFSREILRLTAGQSRLAGIVEGSRTE